MVKDIIGLDIGTSSIKGIRISENGEKRIEGKEIFVYRCGETGQVEIDAEQYLAACCRLLKRLTAAQGEEIAAVCAASASGNLLILDKLGNPSTPILNWQDTRVQEEAKQILQDISAEEIYEAAGWPFDYQTFPLAQLCYLKYHNPEILKNCGKICMSTEYLYWRLSGAWGLSNSAGTPFYLIDQRTGQYNQTLLEVLEIEEKWLPPTGKAGDIVGSITAEGAALSGLPEGTPLILGTFDHPSAARGAGVVDEGQMLLSCGTSWVGFYPVADREKAIHCKMLVDPFHSPEGCWGAMASVSSVAARIEYYIKKYVADGDDMFERFAVCAAQSVPGAGGLKIHLFEEPEEENMKQFSKNEIARAIMEGTVRLLKEKIDHLAQQGIHAKEAVMVGGPSECPLWAEVISQMTGLTVRAAQGAYTGAMGAAIIAATAAGLYENERAAYEGLQER